MHSLNHIELVKASAQDKAPRRAKPAHEQPHAPPGRVRGSVARVLVRVALRVDSESTRRVVA